MTTLRQLFYANAHKDDCLHGKTSVLSADYLRRRIDEIENSCTKTVNGELRPKELLKFIPDISSIANSSDLTSTDRHRVRDALRKVVFNVYLEKTTSFDLRKAIQQLSRP